MKDLLQSILTLTCMSLLLPALASAQSAGIGSADASGALPIPDNDPGGVSEMVPYSSPGMIIDEITEGSLDITHTWVGDLIYSIESPEGTTVVVMDRPGVPASTFGCAGDDVAATFKDTGADGPVEDMCSDLPAIFGMPIPNNPLNTFAGEDPNGTWTFTVSDNAAGDTGTFNSFTLFWTEIPIVANEPGAELPDGYRVSSAYPNPFNPETQLTVEVGQTQSVIADVYNALGQQVARIFEGVVAAGQAQNVTFEADSLPSGLYIVRVSGEAFTTTRRVALLK